MTDAAIARLRGVPLFTACSDKELKFVATRTEEMDFPAGKVLCERGKSGGDFFILLSGEVEVDDGTHRHTLGPGEYFGEIALLDNGPRTATVVTKTPIRALVLGPAQFRDVLGNEPGIATKMLYEVVRRLRDHGLPKTG
jgi:CRP-like cAMP-binding protein